MPFVNEHIWLIHVSVRDNLFIHLIIDPVDALSVMVLTPSRVIDADWVLNNAAQDSPPHIEICLGVISAVIMIIFVHMDL